MISKMLCRRLFIIVNNPWICDINQDPVKICHDMDYILQEQRLTERLGIRTDFKAEDIGELFPVYKAYVNLEAIGDETAIQLGVIKRVDVKNMVLKILVESVDGPMTLELPTDCEDLDSAKYLLKRNNFETRNVMTYEGNNKL